MSYVLDGGSLIHRIKREKGSTYKQIARKYRDLVLKNYQQAIIVFDWYQNGPTTKDNDPHTATSINKNVWETFTDNTNFSGSKDQFLANQNNKSKMISLIGKELKEASYEVLYASDDADVDIASYECSKRSAI